MELWKLGICKFNFWPNIVIFKNYNCDRVPLENLQRWVPPSGDGCYCSWVAQANKSSFLPWIKACLPSVTAFYAMIWPLEQPRISIPLSPWQPFKYLKADIIPFLILYVLRCLNNLSKITAFHIHLDICLSLNSNWSMSLLKCGAQNWILYYRCGLTGKKYNGTVTGSDLCIVISQGSFINPFKKVTCMKTLGKL